MNLKKKLLSFHLSKFVINVKFAIFFFFGLFLILLLSCMESNRLSPGKCVVVVVVVVDEMHSLRTKLKSIIHSRETTTTKNVIEWKKWKYGDDNEKRLSELRWKFYSNEKRFIERQWEKREMLSILRWEKRKKNDWIPFQKHTQWHSSFRHIHSFIARI